MAVTMSSSVLSEMEWDEGLTIPVANDANKRLEDELQVKQKEVTALRNQLGENEDRYNAMCDHLKNIRQELQHTQGLINARVKELESEEHLKKIAEREEGRLTHEIKRLQNELDDLKEKRNISENNIFRQTQRLEEMKSQMNWDQQALEAWLEESARKDEDTMTLQKYTRHDEAKIKELSLRISHLTDELHDKRKQLDHEVTETQTTQIELDKTAEEFRRAHAERQELISQWEHTIDQMQKRDKEMDLLAVQLSKVKSEVRMREDLIKEKQLFLDNEIENNKEQEKKIALSERSAAKLRLEYQQAEQQRDQFQSELDALKRTVDRTAIDLESTRAEVTHLKKDVLEKQDRLDKAKHIHEVLIDKLKQATEMSLSAEERAAQMDQLMSQEEINQRELEAELRNLRESQFKKQQELYQLRTTERNTEAEIQGSRAAIRNLNSKIQRQDHDSVKQQEIVYNQDFEIQQLERRISRMQGEQSNEEKLQLEAKIKQQTDELEKQQSTHALLTQQLKRLQDDVRRVKRDLEKMSTIKEDQVDKIEELNLHNENSQRVLRNIINNKQELMVKDNLLKLEIKRLRDTLNDRSDQVLTLEQRKLQLETAMKERHAEIAIHKEMLVAQLKAAGQERQQVSSELHDRISKIEKLKNRYDILMVSMAPTEGEEEKSQAFYVIKAAQEKEELQREGDELDAKIRKAEKEIRAMENTLRLINGRNETYRQSFKKVTDTSDDMEDKQQCEEQLRAVMDKFKYKRRQIRELTEDLETMGETLDSLSRDESAYVDMIDKKQNKVIQLTKEQEDQQTKLDRAVKQNMKYVKEMRHAQKTKHETPEERDIGVRELREMNKAAMKHIGEAMQNHPEISQTVNLYFSQANLPPPPTLGTGSTSSRHSSRTSSARSSIVSAKSASSVAKRVDLGAEALLSPTGSERSIASSGRSSKRAL